MARRAEEQARTGREMAAASHRLNIIAAIFLPLTALGSMFGMNLVSGLEKQPIWLFWAVLVAGVAIGLGVGRAVTSGLKEEPTTKT